MVLKEAIYKGLYGVKRGYIWCFMINTIDATKFALTWANNFISY